MTKETTAWKPSSGQGDVSSPNDGDFLLQENGDHLLQENGDDILLNETVVTPKDDTVWEDS